MLALIHLNGGGVWPQRRPGSLSTGAGGPMGVLGIRGSVGSRRVYYMSKWWWRSSQGRTCGLRVGVDGPRNILEVSLVVLVVIWAYSEGMSGLAMFAFLHVLSNLVAV